jgi:excisionase family DNA binding protein
VSQEEQIMVLLTVEEAAERLGTTPRFIRRLVAERRIAFIKLGKFVRISAADLEDFVVAGRVEPHPSRRR